MLGQFPEPGAAAWRHWGVSGQLSCSPEKPGSLNCPSGAGAAGVNWWLNGLWFAMGFSAKRFLSPLLDLAWGSIPSPASDNNRSLQPQGCPHLVLTAWVACMLLAGPTGSQGSGTHV